EIELVVKRSVGRVADTALEKRVSVGGRTYNRLGTDIVASTRSVLDDEWPTKAFRQPLTHYARNSVVRATGGRGHDNAHQARRIGLRPCHPRYSRHCRSTRCQPQDLTAGMLCYQPPLIATRCGPTAWRRGHSNGRFHGALLRALPRSPRT